MKNLTRKETEDARGDAESNVIGTERNAKDGQTADSNTNIGDEERVNSWEVGDVSGNETADRIGNTNNRKEERSRFFVDALQVEKSRVYDDHSGRKSIIFIYYYLSGSGVDDVDERNVKSQHAKDV